MNFIIKKITNTRSFFFLICFTLTIGLIHAQDNIYTPAGGEVVLTTQAQVTALDTALGTKTIIAGDIRIKEASGSMDPITDLSAFSGITEIRGFLFINSTKSLTILSHETSGVYAFGALETITSNFLVGDPSATTTLTSLGNFPNLRNIGDGLSISTNAVLSSIDAENFPVLATIGGGLNFSRNPLLSTIESFPALTTIGTGLAISNHDVLTTTGDYPALTTIGENFRVGGPFTSNINDVLTTFGDFSALTSIGGTIVIQRNPMLSDCSSLPASVINQVADAGRDITISDNALGCGSVPMTTQEDVTALGMILGDATIFNGNITINEDSDDATPAITDLSVFSNITEIRGNLVITSTKSITTLSHETSTSGEYAFGALETITGDFTVGTSSSTTSLTSIGNFPNLMNVGGGFSITNNDSLTDMGNYPALTTIGGNVTILDNPKLSNCGGLPTAAVNQVENAGQVFIDRNATGCNISATLTLRRQTDVDALSLGDATLFIGNITIEESSTSPNPIDDLSVFSNITEIRGNFVVLSTKSITTLSYEIGTSGEYAFGALEKITGDFNVGDFGFITTLTNIGNFPNLSSIGGNFAVRNNRDLTTIDADNFPALATIGGDLRIRTNVVLSTVSGFSALRNIGGNFSIANHDSLTNTGDYPALTTIEGDFEIGGGTPEVSNDVLTVLGDFSALDSIGRNITIRYNPMLSNCSGLPASVINQSATISDNGAGCGTDATLTTQAEVDALSLGDATLFIGNITINEPSTSTDSITDLSVFRNITEIRGTFRVSSAKSLTVLSHAISGASGEYAFGALAKITGDFLVGPYNEGAEFTTPWTSLGNFPNLSSVGDNFRVRNNTALESISADNFPVLATVESDFGIKNNGALETIAGFSVLDSVGKNFEINANDILTTTGDYPALTTIEGNITIQNNPLLSNCGGLPTRVIDQKTQEGVASIGNNGSGCNISATLTLATQTDVDALSLGDATLFIGNITIEEDSTSMDSITDLSVFRNITEIRGDFDVISTKSLTALSHEIEGESGVYVFGALETITGDFNVGPLTNSVRTSFTSTGNFPNLRSVGRSLTIRNNSALEQIDADNFPVLKTVGSWLSIESNDALNTLGDFPALKTVGVRFRIISNNVLSTIGDFPALKTVGEDFIIYSHDALTDMGDYPALLAIGSEFQIGGLFEDFANDVLTTLGDFSSLASVGRLIRIQNNPLLSDCSPLPTRAINSVASAGRSVISNNAGGCSSPLLTTQTDVDNFGTALGDATVFTGTITIEDSTSSTDPIDDLSIFRNITEIRGDFNVISTKSLTVLSHETSAGSGEYAFNALETITGDFTVGPNATDILSALANIGNFPNLRNIGGAILIKNNDVLTTIDAENFPVLQTIGGDFSINHNNVLSTVSGFSALRNIGGSFTIHANDSLTDMGDYLALIAIGGNFSIGGERMGSANDVLTTLGDFSALRSIGGNIAIQNNPMLSSCCSLPSRALNHVANEGGDITIQDNKANGGCSDTYPPADSETCVTNYIILKTQAEADGFPDALTHIDNGGVFIGGEVTNLDSLSHVIKIDNLIIRGTTALDELSAITTAAISTTPAVYSGLFGLEEVNNLIVGPARDRRIVNASLDSLGYFPNLTRIGNLEVLFNPALTTLGTFDSLENVDGNLFARSNNLLTHLGNYPALENIHGNLDLQRLPLLTHHGNFPVLDKINGSLSLGFNPLLTALDFPNLTAVNQRILIIDNDTLSDCCDLSAEVIGTSSDVFIARNAAGCQAIAGATDIAAISSATSCIVGNIILRTQSEVDAFPANITQLRGGIVIGPDTDADPITNLNALSALREIGHLTVKKTASLNELVTFNSTTTTKTGLGALKTIRGNLIIGSQNRGNTGLDSLGYFDELTSIGGDINIGYNTSLSRIGTFSALDAIGGFVNIRDNAALQTLGDFSALDSIESILSVYNNLALNALGDFSTLKKIGGSFSIGKSPALLSLGNFPALTQIGGFLSVKDNDAIVSLGKFPLLESIGKGSVFVPSESSIVKNVAIVVEENPSLSRCCAVDLFVEGGANTIMSENALLFFNNNASGCNTQADINCADFLQITANTNIGGDATQTQINIISNTRWQLSKPSTAAWITQLADGITMDADMLFGRNDAVVSITHTANGTPQARTATLTLSAIDREGRVLTTPTAVTIDLTQEIGTPLPYLTLSGTGITDPVSPSTNYTYNAISAGITLTVDVTLTGGATTWTATTSDAFVTFNPATGGNDVNAGLVIAENTTANQRTATVTFTSSGGGDAATQTLLITQLAAGQSLPTLTLAGTGITDPVSPATNYTADAVAAGATLTVDITLGSGATTWTAMITGAFVTSAPTTGGNDDDAVLTIVENTEASQRTATVIFTSSGGGPAVTQTLVITQEAAVLPSITISGTRITPPVDPATNYTYNAIAEGVNLTVDITLAGGAATWTATAPDAFVMLNPTTGGNDDDAVLTIAENTGTSQRTSTITFTTSGGGPVATQTLLITQLAAGQSLPTLTLSGTGVTNPVSPATNYTADAVAAGATLTVDVALADGATTWTATITGAFVTSAPTTGGNDDDAVLTIAENATTTERTATITFVGRGGSVDITQTLIITQAAAVPPPTLALSGTGITDPVSPATNYTADAVAAGATLTVDVTLTDATGWAVTITGAFVTSAPTIGGNDVDAVLTIAENTTTAERTATIVFTSTGGAGTAATQTLVITQGAKTTLSTHTKESLFTLYPNPTEGNLTVEGVTGHLQVYIHDLVGREVMTYSLTPSNKTIDVSNLPSGMYFVTLQGEDKTWTEVLIIDN